MSVGIASIVEGHGEVKSVPSLLTLILNTLGIHDIYALDPMRVHRQEVVKPGQLEQKIKVLVATRRNVGAILVLLDADEDCPAELAPALLDRAGKNTHLPVRVVLARREFEAWFLGCTEPFRGFMGIPDNAVAPEDPEEERDAKGRLERNMHGASYSSKVDQVRFVKRMDLDACRQHCRSFDKLFRDVQALVNAIGEV
jgi:hypothetical protein